MKVVVLCLSFLRVSVGVKNKHCEHVLEKATRGATEVISIGPTNVKAHLKAHQRGQGQTLKVRV